MYNRTPQYQLFFLPKVRNIFEIESEIPILKLQLEKYVFHRRSHVLFTSLKREAGLDGGLER